MIATATKFDLAAWPTETVPCNLCGGTDVSVVAERDRYGLPTRIVQCVACGLRFISPRMSADGYAAFYQHGYRPLFDQLLGRHYTARELEADQWQYAVTLAQLVTAVIPRAPRILDLGGSTGIVARQFMRTFGGTATVVEPCADELRQAKDCQQIQASAEQVEFQPDACDVVLLCRTIDHLLDPRGVLTRIHRWLAPGGVLIVDAMDVTRWPTDYRYKLDHPYAFTAQTIRAVLAATGWAVITDWQRRKGQYVGFACRPQEERTHGSHS